MKRLPSRSLKIAAAFAAAVLLGAGGGVAAYSVAGGPGTQTVVRQVTVTDSQPAANDSALSVSAIYDRVHQGVVTIKVDTQGAQALGSGFVIDGEGHIVTNDHVVEGASSISVEFADGATYNAQLVGADPSTDVAVVKVDAPSSELTPLQFADSGAVQVGDGVVAIGSPLDSTRRSRAESSARSTAPSPRRTTSPSTTPSRPTPPSITATPAGRF
jgi:S1-C subfamily serine protease